MHYKVIGKFQKYLICITLKNILCFKTILEWRNSIQIDFIVSHYKNQIFCIWLENPRGSPDALPATATASGGPAKSQEEVDTWCFNYWPSHPLEELLVSMGTLVLLLKLPTYTYMSGCSIRLFIDD